MKVPWILAIVIIVAGAIPAHTQTMEERELMKLERTWNDAWVKCDTAFLNTIYAREYTTVDEKDGSLITLDEGRASCLKRTEIVLAAKLSDLVARVYGESAVVTGKATIRSTDEGKRKISSTRFTDVFIKRDGRWQCVVNHNSPATAK